jgi:hypothetical protein
MLHLDTVENFVGVTMEYKRFVVRAFEREPGKWRASIRRADGKPVKVIGRKKLEQSVTRFDARMADAAIRMAIAAIDAGTFVRDQAATEKFWRRRGLSSREQKCNTLHTSDLVADTVKN